MKVSIGTCLAVVVAIILGITGSTVAMAQDVYKVNYFNVNVLANRQGRVMIDNPGFTYGNLCAMIYVFASDQQMSECCGCIESHNGLRTLIIDRDLTQNTLTGALNLRGVIKVISAAVNDTPCDPTSNVTPTPDLRVWVTHPQPQELIRNFPTGTIAFTYTPWTETESSDSPLGATELASLQAQCSFIHILGSGRGICTCGTGD